MAAFVCISKMLFFKVALKKSGCCFVDIKEVCIDENTVINNKLT